MKKKQSICLVLAALIALSLFCLASCKPKPEPSAYFVAKVTEVSDARLFVTVIDQGTSSLTGGTPTYVSIDFEGYTACSVGNYIIVEYDTMVQEIYPPIVPNVFSITLCDADGNPLK